MIAVSSLTCSSVSLDKSNRSGGGFGIELNSRPEQNFCIDIRDKVCSGLSSGSPWRTLFAQSTSRLQALSSP